MSEKIDCIKSPFVSEREIIALEKAKEKEIKLHKRLKRVKIMNGVVLTLHPEYYNELKV